MIKCLKATKDLTISLDADDTLWVTEDLADEVLRGIVRFGLGQQKNGEHAGRQEAFRDLRQLLDVPSRFDHDGLDERVTGIEESP